MQYFTTKHVFLSVLLWKIDFCKYQLWFEIAQMRYYSGKYVFLCVLQGKLSFVQVPTLTLNSANVIIHRKTLLFECFTKENPICAIVYSNLNYTNSIFHHKTRLFECFEVENQICASVNSDLTLHKSGIPAQNTSFCTFQGRKSALCKWQLLL